MKRLLIGLIRWYQRHISSRTRPVCRYTPTCSAYAVEAIDRHGAFKGGLMGFVRIMRCNPLGGSGYDPVPDTFTLRRSRKKAYMSDEEAQSLYDTDE